METEDNFLDLCGLYSDQKKRQIQRPRELQTPLESSLKEQSNRLVNIETLITFLTQQQQSQRSIKSDMRQNRNFDVYLFAF